MSKAFDRATWPIILASLFDLGASYDCLIWIYNFLTDRQQIITHGRNAPSPSVHISSGTPQGSIISPILFACLMSTLKTASKNAIFVKYADDVTLITWYTHQSNLQREIDNLLDWCKSNDMKINPSKTKIIHHCGKKHSLPPSVTINSTRIDVCSEAKFLGVILSSDLKWDKHLDSTIKRASKIAFILLQMKRAGCNDLILRKYYQATCRSILSYCFPAMCNMPNSLKSTIAKCERRCLNIVGLRPTTNVITYCIQLCENLKQNVLNNPDHPLRKLLSIHQRNTRSRGLVIPSTRTSRLANSFIKFFS